MKPIISLVFLGIGIFLLVQIAMPVLSFKIWEFSIYNQNQALTSPQPKTDVLGISIENTNNFPAFISNNKRLSNLPYQTFKLSVPSLNLQSLPVAVESNDFEQTLAHLPGTALPGEKGNVFITGHSSLPQLFRSDNFKAIFSNLPKIKKGDEVQVDAGGQNFKYIVRGMKVVSPTETWVINPPDQTGRYLTLMTCVPPGMYLKRLVVLAELI